MSPVQPPLPAVPPPTRALPAVPPPASGSTASAVATAAAPVPTGPVDWMPLPPEPGAEPAAPSPATAADTPGDPHEEAARGRRRVRLPRPPRTPRGGRGAAAAALGAVAVLLLELGLVVHEGGATLWARVPLWSAFATLAALVGLAAVAGLRTAAPLRDRAWGVGAGGLTGLAVFWVLVVLPTADTDRGFVLTASLACLGGSAWLTARRSPAPDAGAAPAVPVEDTAAGEPAGAEPELGAPAG